MEEKREKKQKKWRKFEKWLKKEGKRISQYLSYPKTKDTISKAANNQRKTRLDL